MDRKEFIKSCAKLCVSGIVVGGMLESCTSTYYAISDVTEDKIALNKSEFTYEKDGVQKQRKFVLVRSERLHYPIGIYQLNESVYSALLMECSHNSCELNPHGDYLICPCHGSEFNNLGVVQNPPAEANLINYKVTHDDQKIYIHLA